MMPGLLNPQQESGGLLAQQPWATENVNKELLNHFNKTGWSRPAQQGLTAATSLPPWATPQQFAEKGGADWLNNPPASEWMPAGNDWMPGFEKQFGDAVRPTMLKAMFPHWSDSELQHAMTGVSPLSGDATSPAGDPLPPGRSPQGPGSPGIPPISEGMFPNPPFEPFPTKIPVDPKARQQPVALGAQPGSGPSPGETFPGPFRGMTMNEGRDLITDQAQEALAWLRGKLKTVPSP